ncbi:hypothetical protein EJB05_39269, partial [Eragrostis curvula]
MGGRGKAKRRRRDLSSSAGDAIDLISGLGDDVLVRILELMPDTRDAVRTDALSRRWRGLWTRVPDLRFASDSWPEFSAATDAERFAALVDGALALRAAHTDPTIENLAVSFNLTSLSGHDESRRVVPPSVTAVQGWIHFAVRHELKTLDLELQLPAIYNPSPSRMRVTMNLDSLQGSAKMETMRLALGHAILHLPSSAVFASLTDLTLELVVFAHGTLHLLTRLLSSSCCPRLQKLRLRKIGLLIARLQDLPIEASALLELSLEDIDDPGKLQLRTPSLRVLLVNNCSMEALTLAAPKLRVLRVNNCYMKALTLAAPKLERLVFLGNHSGSVYVEDGLPGVRRLKVELRSHDVDQLRPKDFMEADLMDIDYYINDDPRIIINKEVIRLLQCCTSLNCLNVSLRVPKMGDRNLIEYRIPHLPLVASLVVRASLLELHLSLLEDSVESLLTKCSNLRHLRLHLEYSMNTEDVSTLRFSSWDRMQSLKSYKILLPHLEKVEIKGLAGTNRELMFTQFVLSSTTELQKATISFDEHYMSKGYASELLPSLGNGTWTACPGTSLQYKWRRHL